MATSKKNKANAKRTLTKLAGQRIGMIVADHDLAHIFDTGAGEGAEGNRVFRVTDKEVILSSKDPLKYAIGLLGMGPACKCIALAYKGVRRTYEHTELGVLIEINSRVPGEPISLKSYSPEI